MSHTNETTSNMTTLIQRFATLQVAVSMTREELEDQLHTEVWRSDWEEVLRLLGLAKGDVSRGAANECMTLAVQKAPVEVIRAMLDLLPAGEYTECDTYLVDWSPTGEVRSRLKWEVNVQGTMTMHAVAQNRPDVLELLLNHGYDVNCASAAAVTGLLQDHNEHIVGYGSRFIPYQAYTARPENYIRLQDWDTTPDDSSPMQWEGATPLALAILMGHADCARILVERGAWLEEAPSVSAAMYLFWREKDPAYQAARAAVLQKGDHARHRPVLWAVGKSCSPRQLKSVLDAWHYAQTELERAAREMIWELSCQRALRKSYTDGWKDLCQRMYRIGRVCPEVLQARPVIGPFLDMLLRWKGVEITPLLPFLEGTVLDISEMYGGGLYYLSRPAGQKFFSELAGRCKLVMDRDAVPAGLSEQALRTVIRYVEFLPPVMEQGVSSLTKQILAAGDLRMIRKALQTGLIPPEESTEELLRCQQELHFPVVCRTALLTTRRPAKGALAERPSCGDIMGRWFSEKIMNPAMPILTEEDWKKWLYPTLRHDFGRWETRINGWEWQMHKTLFAVCAEGRRDILEAWLPNVRRSDLCNTDSMVCAERRVQLVLTPLCAAALAGQTEIVELLLEYGAPLHEEMYGYPSIWVDCCGMDDKEKTMPLNVVLAAALGGHWDTVNLLLERGAVCDWSAPETQHIRKQFRTENAEETVCQNLERRAAHELPQ